MADKVVLEAEIKSNIGKVSKETKELTNDFGAFGITVGGVKQKFKDVAQIMNNGLKQVALQAKLAGVGFKKMFSGNIIGGAKTLFGVIKTGIAATGIGALVIAFTSLVTLLTKTKRGAEALEVVFAGLGATVNVLTDRLSKVGGAIVKLFQGDTKGALTDVKGAFTGIGEEIANDTKEAIALKKAFIALRDSERDLNVETAQRRAEIESLKLIAEDVSKSEEERLGAAKKAFNIENNLLNKRVANAKEALRLQQEEMALGENTQADLDKEAELLIKLADIRAESTTKQIELNNKINAIEAEVAAKRQEREDARLQEIEDEKEAKLKAIEDEKKAAQDLFDKQMEQAEEKAKKAKREAEEEELNAKKVKETKIAFAKSGLRQIEKIAGEGSEIAKGAAVAQATISGIEAVQNAHTTAQKSPITAFFPGYPIVQAGIAAAFSAAQIQKILSTSTSGEGGGGSASVGGAGAATAAAATPAPQMMSGAFELGAGVEPEPTRAYVVTDEMTNSQNQLANIRRRATI